VVQQNRLNNGQPFTIIHPENPVPKPSPDPLLTWGAARLATYRAAWIPDI